MRILRSNDPDAPPQIHALLTALGYPPAILVVDRGDASEAEVKDALQDFERRHIEEMTGRAR